MIIIIPILFSIFFTIMFFRPIKKGQGDYGFISETIEGLIRLFWVIPLLIVWIFYLIFKLMF